VDERLRTEDDMIFGRVLAACLASILVGAAHTVAQEPPPPAESPAVLTPGAQVPAPQAPPPAQFPSQPHAPSPPQQPAAPPQNVLLEIAITAGQGQAAPRVYQLSHMLTTGRPHSFEALREVPIGNSYRPTGVRVRRVELQPQGKGVQVTAHMQVHLPPPAGAGAEAQLPALPATFDHHFSVVLESGKRTTISAVQLPGIEGLVSMHLTATTMP
jgi:hypothetical protein